MGRCGFFVGKVPYKRWRGNRTQLQAVNCRARRWQAAEKIGAIASPLCLTSFGIPQRGEQVGWVGNEYFAYGLGKTNLFPPAPWKNCLSRGAFGKTIASSLPPRHQADFSLVFDAGANINTCAMMLKKEGISSSVRRNYREKPYASDGVQASVTTSSVTGWFSSVPSKAARTARLRR